MNDIKYMKVALKEAQKAFKKNEIPIGCVIVKNEKIIAKAHNKREKTKKISAHAEIIAIEKASKKIKNWHLNDCILYTTIEPCLMCTGAILQSRIKRVVYSAKNDNYGELCNINNYLNKIDITYGILENESKKIMKKFFVKKRK